VKKLVAPLLARNPDLALVGHLIALKPVHHILRGIYIDRTGQARQCLPTSMVMELFFKRDDVVFGAEKRLWRDKPGIPGLWWLDDPEISADLVTVAERDALPRLRSIRTLQDYLEAVLPKDPRELKFAWGIRFLFAVAMGDLDAARGFLESDRQNFYARQMNEFRPGLGDRLLKDGARVSADDRQALADYLHACEAYTVGKLKVGHLWERTPFPIERQ
jgi:hypothetical protein